MRMRMGAYLRESRSGSSSRPVDVLLKRGTGCRPGSCTGTGAGPINELITSKRGDTRAGLERRIFLDTGAKVSGFMKHRSSCPPVKSDKTASSVTRFRAPTRR